MVSEHTRICLTDLESFALLSHNSATETAIVYVHGFWGGPASTWEDIVYFVDRIDGEPFATSDLFFFDYPAEKGWVSTGVNLLRAFVERLYPNPPKELFSVQMKDVDWRLAKTDDLEFALRFPKPYKRLILVGHSLGAVVIRRLVVDDLLSLSHGQSIEEDHAALTGQVRLFAPAHLGFRPAAANKVLWSTPGVGALLRMLAFSNRAFLDLTEDCYTLTQLRRETEKAARDFPSVDALKPLILWGENEDIVLVGRYDTDPPRRTLPPEPNQGHIQICKARADYSRAAYFVALELGVGA